MNVYTVIPTDVKSTGNECLYSYQNILQECYFTQQTIKMALHIKKVSGISVMSKAMIQSFLLMTMSYLQIIVVILTLETRHFSLGHALHYIGFLKYTLS